jgi:hypothetical protein
LRKKPFFFAEGRTARSDAGGAYNVGDLAAPVQKLPRMPAIFNFFINIL